jgi:putative ABC transport system permease protein
MDPVGINYDLPYRLEGEPRNGSAGEEFPQADFRVLTPGYFQTFGVPLLRGRTFTEFDNADAPFVMLVNQTMAQQVWPNQDPVGQRVETPSTEWHWFEVVGVVGDTRYYGLASEPRPEFYVAHAQVPRTEMSYVIRAEGQMGSLTDRVRREVLNQDPGQPTHGIVSVESLVSDTIAAERFYALVLGIFAVVALLLSGAGVYGVLSYWVSHRTQEIGLRMALGADASRVLRLVVMRGMLFAGAGVLVGLAGAFASTRVLSSVLFEVGTRDPVTFVGVAAALSAIALLACWVPAFRASRVDPVVALRE